MFHFHIKIQFFLFFFGSFTIYHIKIVIQKWYQLIFSLESFGKESVFYHFVPRLENPFANCCLENGKMLYQYASLSLSLSLSWSICSWFSWNALLQVHNIYVGYILGLTGSQLGFTSAQMSQMTKWNSVIVSWA